MTIVMSSFLKAPFSKCFPSRLKLKASVFKFLQFKGRFRKSPLPRRIGVDGRASVTRETRLRFLGFGKYCTAIASLHVRLLVLPRMLLSIWPIWPSKDNISAPLETPTTPHFSKKASQGLRFDFILQGYFYPINWGRNNPIPSGLN